MQNQIPSTPFISWFKPNKNWSKRVKSCIIAPLIIKLSIKTLVDILSSFVKNELLVLGGKY